MKVIPLMSNRTGTCLCSTLVVRLFMFYTNVSKALAVNPLYDSTRNICPYDQYVVYLEADVQKCRDCTVCKKGFERVKYCSQTEDAVCKPCPFGTYNNVTGDGECKTCSVCKPGQYMRKYCNPHRDTVCKSCPSRRYSVKENAKLCRLCTKCKRNEVTTKSCSKDNNTVCGNCKVDFFREFGSHECLPCTKCHEYISTQVILECANTFGLKEKNQICWPRPKDALPRTSTSTVGSTAIDLITDSEESADILEEVTIRATVVFTGLLVILFLTSCFICVAIKSFWGGPVCASCERAIPGQGTYQSDILTVDIVHTQTKRETPYNTNMPDLLPATKENCLSSTAVPGTSVKTNDNGYFSSESDTDSTELLCTWPRNEKPSDKTAIDNKSFHITFDEKFAESTAEMKRTNIPAREKRVRKGVKRVKLPDEKLKRPKHNKQSKRTLRIKSTLYDYGTV